MFGPSKSAVNQPVSPPGDGEQEREALSRLRSARCSVTEFGECSCCGSMTGHASEVREDRFANQRKDCDCVNCPLGRSIGT
jgi:hypothetical protein